MDEMHLALLNLDGLVLEDRLQLQIHEQKYEEMDGGQMMHETIRIQLMGMVEIQLVQLNLDGCVVVKFLQSVGKSHSQ